MFFTVAITYTSTKNSLGFRVSDGLFRIILMDDSTSRSPKQACSLHCFLLTGFLQDAPFDCFACVCLWTMKNTSKLTQD